MKKATKATFKSFIKNNRENLLIENKSSFCGNNDCVMPTGKEGFDPVKWKNDGEGHRDYDFGIIGVWVTSGKNWFDLYETETHTCLSCDNCCGSFTLAIKK